MAIRAFFRKVREIEQGISSDFVVVVSNETTDGGKPGVETEVSRIQAARLIADSKARLATPEETAAFYQAVAERWRQANTLYDPPQESAPPVTQKPAKR